MFDRLGLRLTLSGLVQFHRFSSRPEQGREERPPTFSVLFLFALTGCCRPRQSFRSSLLTGIFRTGQVASPQRPGPIAGNGQQQPRVGGEGHLSDGERVIGQRLQPPPRRRAPEDDGGVLHLGGLQTVAADGLAQERNRGFKHCTRTHSTTDNSQKALWEFDWQSRRAISAKTLVSDSLSAFSARFQYKNTANN